MADNTPTGSEPREQQKMRVLVACEESQAVTKELRALGHEAFSCDVLPCSGGHPEWHLQQDVLGLLFDKWDLVIAHPPCTYLANSGVRWLYTEDGSKNKERWEAMRKGAEFFRVFLNLDCPVAIENPVMHKHAVAIIGRRQDQVIQPWQFGHGETKATGLWLKRLPKLVPTDVVEGREQRVHRMPQSKRRASLRSKTYPGIAKAMAGQWTASKEE